MKYIQLIIVSIVCVCISSIVEQPREKGVTLRDHPILYGLDITLVDAEYIRKVDGDRVVWGQYDNNDNKIVVAIRRDREDVIHTLHHEAGHYVWFKIMSSDDMKKYCIAWGKEQYHTSDYSQTSCVENYAELFAHYNTTIGKTKSFIVIKYEESEQFNIIKESTALYIKEQHNGRI